MGKAKKILVITGKVIALLILVGIIGSLIALPFKETQLLIFKFKTRSIYDPREMIPLYKAFIDRYPAYISPRLKLAGIYANAYFILPDKKLVEKEKYLEHAIEGYKKIIEMKPNEVAAFEGLGSIYMGTNELGKALDNYKTLCAIAPEKGLYSMMLARAYLANKLTDQAIIETKKVIISEPKNMEVRFFAATIFDMGGDLSEALAEYRQAVSLYETQKNKKVVADIHTRLGRCYARLGMSFEAVEELETALRINPALTGAYLGLASIYSMSGLYEKCISTLNDSPLFAPKSKLSVAIPSGQMAIAYQLLSSAYFGKGDFIAALAYLKKSEAEGMPQKKEFVKSITDLAKKQQMESEEKSAAIKK